MAWVLNAICTLLGLLHDECERRTREQLPATELQTASAQGDGMNFDDAAAFALDEHV